AKLIVEGVLNKNINNEGVKQMYKHTIVYDGEVDKISATVVGWVTVNCFVDSIVYIYSVQFINTYNLDNLFYFYF
ncbi:hypothetical protein ACTPEF_26225, partial [Clostridioides difficile]